MLWEVDIYPAAGQPDRLAQKAISEAAELGIAKDLKAAAATGYLIQGSLDRSDVERLVSELLSDQIVERAIISQVGDPRLAEPPADGALLIHVLPKPGVMDPVAESAKAVISDSGFTVEAVRTLKKFWLADISGDTLASLAAKVLANDAIEEVIVGPLRLNRLNFGAPYHFQLVTVPTRPMDDCALVKLSREGQLSLSLDEMQTIQLHFRQLGRDATDVELETIAQTWSEHCSHKTLAGRISYTGPTAVSEDQGSGASKKTHYFENMLKETIFAATQTIRKNWRDRGEQDWCVSVFEDNAGIVRFDDRHNVAFKVETHNHPSALEPYGGANTGVGGVIRDTLGTGLGAKPIANTDVFCFAPPDVPADSMPPGVLHPRRVIKGVVSGVRDYGNRMGIPTVNGAVFFDERYLSNPLVYCGNVGILPADKSRKSVQPGDLIVAIGGRTGRDGIHGATFSSLELTSRSESISGGAVQIGNAITEKKVLDVVLAARDRNLFNAITDCGAGGFSSAVGEMGAKIGAVVHLDRAPLKYAGLSYTEIWISEAQERMVLSVSPERWSDLEALCRSEIVEATVIGEFKPTGRLQLLYEDQQVADLSMDFLHDGRPEVVREAIYTIPEFKKLLPQSQSGRERSDTRRLLAILGALNVCSRQWIVRQYDHEVQGASVIKPLVGACNDGPSDAAVLRPVPGSHRGIAISCGMNPRYADFDTYHMAASAIDEAIRNCVAVGANPSRTAILDNFCWADCNRPEMLGSLVRAALACRDVAIALGTPFISGKDSLNNEFRCADADGHPRSIAIPPSLLISALGQVDDVRRCVTMDLKKAGSVLYQVGLTKNELGGSHYSLAAGLTGGRSPQVDPVTAKATFAALHRVLQAGYVLACHDLSEGGLAVAAAEMAIAGRLGTRLYLTGIRHNLTAADAREIPGGLATALLFSESNSRFLVEVPVESVGHFEETLGNVPHSAVGEVLDSKDFVIADIDPMAKNHLIETNIDELTNAWKSPLNW